MINLEIPEHSYFFGFAQSDGHLRDLSRNRGSFILELKSIDSKILFQFCNLFNCKSTISSRSRTTNFGIIETTSLSYYNLNFRKELKFFGFPSGNKSELIKPPLGNFSKIDYIRGLIDGDGSIGVTSKGFPFVSLITKSNYISEYILNWLSINLNKELKQSFKNKRDSIFNIMINAEDAQLISNILYYDNCLSLERKYKKAIEIRNWVRPSNIKKIDFQKKKWNKIEDEFILAHDIKESCVRLNRTKNSIETRIWRLKNDK